MAFLGVLETAYLQIHNASDAVTSASPSTPSGLSLVSSQGQSAADLSAGFSVTTTSATVILTAQQPTVGAGQNIAVNNQYSVIVTGGQALIVFSPAGIADVVSSYSQPSINSGQSLNITSANNIAVQGQSQIDFVILTAEGPAIVTIDGQKDQLLVVGNPEASGRRTLCLLTGAGNGTTDILLPISSYVSRINSQLELSITIVVPNGADFKSLILDRKDGGLIFETQILFSDGSTLQGFSTETPLTGISSDQGARSHSVTLTAKETLPSVAAKVVKISGQQSINTNEDGQLRIRCVLESSALVGDTALDEEGRSFIINAITNVINGSSRYMELSSVGGYI